MERGDEWCRLAGKKGEWIIIEMKVQEIEIVSPLASAGQRTATAPARHRTSLGG
jgi:hypothetical protein